MCAECYSLGFPEGSSLVFDLLHALKGQELFHFVFKLLLDILVVGELLETWVLHVEHAIDVVLMVARTPLAVHLLEVVEVVRVDFVKEPGAPSHCLLHRHEQRAAYPVDKCACWPLVREWQVEKLQHLEERPKSIDKPVLVLLCDPSLHQQIIISQSGTNLHRG